MEVAYYRDGQTTEATLTPACRSRIPDLVGELVAGAEPVRLMVSEEQIGEIRAEREAIEVVFAEPRQLGSAAGSVRRVLVPLSGEAWEGSAERPVAMVLLGDQAYGAAPLANPTGWPLALELRRCVVGK